MKPQMNTDLFFENRKNCVHPWLSVVKKAFTWAAKKL